MKKILLKVAAWSSLLAASGFLLSQGTTPAPTHQIFEETSETKDPLLALSEELAAYFSEEDFAELGVEAKNPAEAIKEYLEKGGQIGAHIIEEGEMLLMLVTKDTVTFTDGKRKDVYSIEGELISSEEV